jgi:hypothetical protein
VRKRIRMLAAAGLAVATLLTGCVAIPMSGDVQTVPLDVEPDELTLIALQESPVAGMTQAEILRGFLRAGRGPQNNYSVAEEYLTAGAAAEWSGTDQVLISATPLDPTAIDESTQSITLAVSAEVDATGRYSTVSSQQTLTYGFAQVDGEWRISSAPPGTVLTPSGFSLAFDEYRLYFYDPSFRFLVPDPRWFPVTRAAAQRILDQLLAEPAPWLGSGVLVSAFPSGLIGSADYAAPGVDVELGVEARTESALAQRRMLWQLDATLRGAFGNVTEVSVTADGLPLAPAADEGAPEYRFQVRDVFGGVGGALGTLTSDGVTPLAEIGSRADALGPTAASLARSRDAVAVLSSAGVSVVTASGAPIPIDDRAGLIAPSLDPHGDVWTVPANNPRGLLATSVADGVPHALPLDAEGTVVSLEVARDGARLLVAMVTAQGPRVFVVGIIRDADLVPIGFAAPYELAVTGTVLGATWVDPERVAVLVTAATGTRVEILALGGPGERIDGADGGVQIVGGTSTDGIRVRTADGRVLRPSGAGVWVDTGLVASFLGIQQ